MLALVRACSLAFLGAVPMAPPTKAAWVAPSTLIKLGTCPPPPPPPPPWPPWPPPCPGSTMVDVSMVDEESLKSPRFALDSDASAFVSSAASCGAMPIPPAPCPNPHPRSSWDSRRWRFVSEWDVVGGASKSEAGMSNSSVTCVTPCRTNAPTYLPSPWASSQGAASMPLLDTTAAARGEGVNCRELRKSSSRVSTIMPSPTPTPPLTPPSWW
mmetsp:Transcript_29648/g.53708  ORF Transcript_29648/g.53708 Transcript_29648/m.53708 type:complete len:213 (-) Transcript_29648:261-899(-)